MPLSETLSTYSDWTYGSAVAIYLLAMVFYLIEQAFSRAAVNTQAGVLVGSGGSELAETPPEPTEPAEPERSRPERFGRMAVAATTLGAALHLCSLVLRGAAAERVPWGNMYEFGSVLCLVAVVTWLVLVRRFPVRRLGGFVLLPTVILMFVGGTLLYTNAAPVQPALQSYWLVIHVFTVAASSGVLLVPGVASVLYLIVVASGASPEHTVRPGRLARLAARLPTADTLDRLAYRTTIFAFPVYTFGVICGAIWAEAAWGRFWGWDPKETTAFVAWVIYAAYLHSRATAGWRGTRAAAINAVAFAVMVFNLFFINLVISGLHSYAGV